MINKIVIIIIVFFMAISCTYAYTIKGAVSINVETARKISFSGVDKQIDMQPYKLHFSDVNNFKNNELMNKGKSKAKARKLTRFSDGTYCVKYLYDYTKAYYTIMI